MEIARSRGAGITGTARKVFSAMFRNALVIGIVLGFVVNLSGAPLPMALQDALDLIVRAALPAALFGLGRRALPLPARRATCGSSSLVCAVSLILHPAVVWGVWALETGCRRKRSVRPF